MERKQKVLLALNKLSEKNKELIKFEIGFTAEEVAREAGISRCNASSDLNSLVKAGIVIKFNGRPVRFISKKYYEQYYKSNDSLNTLKIEVDPFSSIIGWNMSLRDAIDEARAAINYPPFGLHTLLIGPTGSGKTYFAKKMFEYAKNIGRISDKSDFVAFNCADYAHNPQLLMSHLFGHIKGAFTGANNEKSGLVDSANNSILFLDEIHRLPPEGQEMLFYLMDTGQYRRLGETNGFRTCQTMIIGATTADPHSSLLNTFYRRFPVVIRIPSLSERPIAEKKLMVKQFFTQEAHKIGRPLKIATDVIKSFIMYDCIGNIGQLINDIKVTCAKALLNAIKNGMYEIKITREDLPPHVKKVLLNDNSCDDFLLINIMLDEEWNFDKEDAYDDDVIGEIYSLLNEKEKNKNTVEKKWSKAKSLLENYYKNHINKIYQNKDRVILNLTNIIGQDVLSIANECVKIIKQNLKVEIDKNILPALALHIYACRERIMSGLRIENPYIDKIKREYPEELNVANMIVELMKERLKLDIPADEASFLAMLIRSNEKNEDAIEKPVGVVVMCYGDSTASSMVATANKIIGSDIAIPIDIPVDSDPKQYLEYAMNEVIRADKGNGVLLLVDIKRFVSWGEIIAAKTGIKINIIENVNTSMVIEAVRKARRMKLEDLSAEIENFNKYPDYWVVDENKKSKTLILTCITGKGTATRLKELIRDLIKDDDINLVTLNINGIDIESGLKADYFKKKEKPVAIVGSVDLKIPGVPFISLEDLFFGDGENRIAKLLNLENVNIDITPTEIENVLKYYLRFLDNKKIYKLCTSIINRLKESGFKLKTHQIINLTLHLSCLVERIISGEDFGKWPKEEKIRSEYKHEWDTVSSALSIIERELNILIPDSEVAYIVQYLMEG
ncbi:sigma 54-interacting transcriptional regulator [Thermoanaerobacter wiegelii]|uniref:PTS system transcriptional activator n=1 Tax=Thermoanaerobacter wiegelii Rt8.B1 TaxID=697303 RepID=G2MTU1_9THEO|nr:sigma-54-dependent transcriptional regulator [Thermoanaerobacter wiegelii]AEM79476.1 PTS system transcriptional activator [Thermoanaerobacter wiegelii Rt8.B1]